MEGTRRKCNPMMDFSKFASNEKKKKNTNGVTLLKVT
jgi:hypothetical protein